MRSYHLLYIFTLLMGIFYRDFTYLGISAPVPGGTLFITELFITLFITLGLIKFSILKGLRRWIVLNQKVLVCYFCFSFSAIAALIYSDWASTGMVIREFASYYYSLFFFFPIFLINNEKKMEMFIKVILIATCLALFLILFRAAMGMGNINSTGQLRYGNYETVGILILVSWLFRKPFDQWNFLSWVVFSVSIFITLIFINHRSSIISIVVVIIIANYFNYKNGVLSSIKNMWSIFAILFVLSIPFIFIYHNAFSSAVVRLLTIFSPTEETNSSWRLFVWKMILSDMSIFDMFFGKGWGWQIPIFEFNNRIYGANNEIRGFHNSSLFYFYHIGIFGFGAFSFFIINVYKNAKKSLINSTNQIQKKINSLITANIGIFIFSMFNVVFEGPYMSFFFWITLGMIYHYPNLHNYGKGSTFEK